MDNSQQHTLDDFENQSPSPGGLRISHPRHPLTMEQQYRQMLQQQQRQQQQQLLQLQNQNQLYNYRRMHSSTAGRRSGNKDLIIRMLAEVFQVTRCEDGQLRWRRVSSSLVPVSLYSRTTGRWLDYLLNASDLSSQQQQNTMSFDSRALLNLMQQQQQQVQNQAGNSTRHHRQANSSGGAQGCCQDRFYHQQQYQNHQQELTHPYSCGIDGVNDRIVFQVVAHDFIQGQCRKILSVRISHPDTRLGLASDHFVYWKEPINGHPEGSFEQSNGGSRFSEQIMNRANSAIVYHQLTPFITWGLNFASINDAKLFYDICSLNHVDLDFNSEYLRQVLDQEFTSSGNNLRPYRETSQRLFETQPKMMFNDRRVMGDVSSSSSRIKCFTCAQQARSERKVSQSKRIRSRSRSSSRQARPTTAQMLANGSSLSMPASPERRPCPVHDINLAQTKKQQFKCQNDATEGLYKEQGSSQEKYIEVGPPKPARGQPQQRALPAPKRKAADLRSDRELELEVKVESDREPALTAKTERPSQSGTSNDQQRAAIFATSRSAQRRSTGVDARNLAQVHESSGQNAQLARARYANSRNLKDFLSLDVSAGACAATLNDRPIVPRLPQGSTKNSQPMQAPTTACARPSTSTADQAQSVGGWPVRSPGEQTSELPLELRQHAATTTEDLPLDPVSRKRLFRLIGEPNDGDAPDRGRESSEPTKTFDLLDQRTPATGDASQRAASLGPEMGRQLRGLSSRSDAGRRRSLERGMCVDFSQPLGDLKRSLSPVAPSNGSHSDGPASQTNGSYNNNTTRDDQNSLTVGSTRSRSKGSNLGHRDLRLYEHNQQGVDRDESFRSRKKRVTSKQKPVLPGLACGLSSIDRRCDFQASTTQQLTLEPRLLQLQQQNHQLTSFKSAPDIRQPSCDGTAKCVAQLRSTSGATLSAYAVPLCAGISAGIANSERLQQHQSQCQHQAHSCPSSLRRKRPPSARLMTAECCCQPYQHRPLTIHCDKCATTAALGHNHELKQQRASGRSETMGAAGFGAHPVAWCGGNMNKHSCSRHELSTLVAAASHLQQQHHHDHHHMQYKKFPHQSQKPSHFGGCPCVSVGSCASCYRIDPSVALQPCSNLVPRSLHCQDIYTSDFDEEDTGSYRCVITDGEGKDDDDQDDDDENDEDDRNNFQGSTGTNRGDACCTGRGQHKRLMPVQGYDQTLARASLKSRIRARSQPPPDECRTSVDSETMRLSKSVENIQKLIKEVQFELNALARKPLMSRLQLAERLSAAWAATGMGPSAPTETGIAPKMSVDRQDAIQIAQEERQSSRHSSQLGRLTDTELGSPGNRRAAQFKCVGAIRKAGFLSVKKWISKRRQSVELARKQGWKRYWVCLRGTALLFYSLLDRKLTEQEAQRSQEATALLARTIDLWSWIEANRCAGKSQLETISAASDVTASGNTLSPIGANKGADASGLKEATRGCHIDKEPRHLIIVEGSIAQPVPEHPKRDFVFCLSTALGDAYLFQASCQLEADNWISAIHNACAASVARDLTRDETTKLFETKISNLELEAEKKLFLRQRLESRLLSMSSMGGLGELANLTGGGRIAHDNPKLSEVEPENSIGYNQKQSADQQLQAKRITMRSLLQRLSQQLLALDNYIEQVHCEIYQLRCYLSSCGAQQGFYRMLRAEAAASKAEGFSGAHVVAPLELPHPKTLLMHISKPTKMLLIKLGVFTVCSFHTYMHARQGSTESLLHKIQQQALKEQQQDQQKQAEAQVNDDGQSTDAISGINSTRLRSHSMSSTVAGALRLTSAGISTREELEKDTEQLMQISDLRELTVSLSKQLLEELRRAAGKDELGSPLSAGSAGVESGSDHSLRDQGDHLELVMRLNANSSAFSIVKQALMLLAPGLNEQECLNYYLRLVPKQQSFPRTGSQEQQQQQQQQSYVARRRETLVDWLEFGHAKLEKKILFRVELERDGMSSAGDQALPFGLALGAQLVTVPTSGETMLNVYASYIEWAGAADKAGLRDDDELLLINGVPVLDLDMMFVECMIEDSTKLRLLVRSSRPLAECPSSANLVDRSRPPSGLGGSAGNRACEGGGSSGQPDFPLSGQRAHQAGESAKDTCPRDPEATSATDETMEINKTKTNGQARGKEELALQMMLEANSGSTLISDEYIASIVCPPPPPPSAEADAFLCVRPFMLKYNPDSEAQAVVTEAVDSSLATSELVYRLGVASVASGPQCPASIDVAQRQPDGVQLADQLMKRTERLRAMLGQQIQLEQSPSSSWAADGLEPEMIGPPEDGNTSPRHSSDSVEPLRRVQDGKGSVSVPPARQITNSSRDAEANSLERLKKSTLELLETEYAFIRHLETINEHYMIPLAEVAYLDISDLSRLSDTIIRLIAFQRDFFAKLIQSISFECQLRLNKPNIAIATTSALSSGAEEPMTPNLLSLSTASVSTSSSALVAAAAAAPLIKSSAATTTAATLISVPPNGQNNTNDARFNSNTNQADDWLERLDIVLNRLDSFSTSDELVPFLSSLTKTFNQEADKFRQVYASYCAAFSKLQLILHPKCIQSSSSALALGFGTGNSNLTVLPNVLDTFTRSSGAQAQPAAAAIGVTAAPVPLVQTPFDSLGSAISNSDCINSHLGAATLPAREYLRPLMLSLSGGGGGSGGKTTGGANVANGAPGNGTGHCNLNLASFAGSSNLDNVGSNNVQTYAKAARQLTDAPKCLKQLNEFLANLDSSSSSVSISLPKSSSSSIERMPSPNSHSGGSCNSKRRPSGSSSGKDPKVVPSTSPSASVSSSNLQKSVPQQNFESYLIKPIQRIVKYPMLLGSIMTALKMCSNFINEHSNLTKELQQAVKQMESVASHVNDAQKIHDEYDAIFENIQRLFAVKMETELAKQNIHKCSSPHQPPVSLSMDQLLYFGPVEWLNVNEFNPKLKKGVQLVEVLFVFSSCVVFICKELVRSNKKKLLSANVSHTNVTQVFQSKSLDFNEIIRYQSLIPVSEVQVRSVQSNYPTNIVANKQTTGSNEHNYRWELFRCSPINSNSNLLTSKQADSNGKVYQLASPTNEIRNAFLRKIRFIIRESVRNMSLPLARSPSNKSSTPKKSSSPSSCANTNSSRSHSPSITSTCCNVDNKRCYQDDKGNIDFKFNSNEKMCNTYGTGIEVNN